LGAEEFVESFYRRFPGGLAGAGGLLELEFSAEIYKRLLKNGVTSSWIVLGLESCQVVAGSFPGGSWRTE
jgi:hypothetical protein